MILSDDIDTNNSTNTDEVCSTLIIQFQLQHQNNEQQIYILQQESYTLHNKSVWTDTNTFLSHDGDTQLWELSLPSTSAIPDIYRTDSNATIPPSTIWHAKYSGNTAHITFQCEDGLITPSPTSAPTEDVIYPSMSLILSYYHQTQTNNKHDKSMQSQSAFMC